MGRTKQTPFTEQAANGMQQHDSGMQKQIVKASAGEAMLGQSLGCAPIH